MFPFQRTPKSQTVTVSVNADEIVVEDPTATPTEEPETVYPMAPLVHFNREAYNKDWGLSDLPDGGDSRHGWGSHDEDDDLEFDNYDDNGFEKEVRLTRPQMGDFLERSRAIETPIEVFAFWLALYMKQGGKPRYIRDYNYVNSPVYTLDSNMKSVPLTTAGKHWTLTRNTGARIPSGYGSMALDLVLVPSVTGQDMAASTYDDRAGWEYGHTRAYTFERGDDGQMKAVTNNDMIVSSYRDVQALIRATPYEELKARALQALRAMFDTDTALTVKSVPELTK